MITNRLFLVASIDGGSGMVDLIRVLAVAILIVSPGLLSCAPGTQTSPPVASDNQSAKPRASAVVDDKSIYTVDNATFYGTNMELKTHNKSATFDFSNPNRHYVTMDIPDELRYKFDADTQFAVCAGANGEPIVITNNPDAKDATYDEIIEFLRNDNTDNIPYLKGSFECGEYARVVHDNAESNGIKAGVVPIIKICPKGHYTNHIWNVFRAADVKGLLFIDCTNSSSIIEDGGWYGDIAIVYDSKNQSYTRVSLFRDGKPYDKVERSDFRIVGITQNW